MQQIINLTDRSVDIGCRTILRSGTVAVVTIRETSSEFDGVTVVNRELGEVEGLPTFDPEGEVLYVVDPLVQRALPDRPDLVTVRESGVASPQVCLARIDFRPGSQIPANDAQPIQTHEKAIRGSAFTDEPNLEQPN